VFTIPFRLSGELDSRFGNNVVVALDPNINMFAERVCRTFLPDIPTPKLTGWGKEKIN